MPSKEYTVKELIETLQSFKEDDIIIVRGSSNGTFSHKIDEVSYGKSPTTQGKVCIYGKRC